MDRDRITRTGAKDPWAWRPMRDGEGLPAINLAKSPGEWEQQDRVAKVGEGMCKRETGRHILIDGRHAWSRTGENPPYGILEGAMETSNWPVGPADAPLLYSTEPSRRTP